MGEQKVADAMADEAMHSRWLWPLLWGMIAASLWAQWLGPGAAAELRSEDGSSLVLALQLLPLGAGLIALIWRHPAALLALFPVSFLPGLALLPQAEWVALSSVGASLSSLATFGLYLLVAASVPRQRWLEPQRQSRDVEGESGDLQARAFRRFVILRFGAVGVLFGVITYALFFAPHIQQLFAGLETDEAIRTQHVFAVITLYFSWMITVYIAAVLPSLNWEYRRRRSAISQVERRLLREPKRLRRRVVMWLGCLLLVAGLASLFLW